MHSNSQAVNTPPTSCKAFAAITPGGKIVPHQITRRPCSPHDIVINILYSGICHSDIHQARNDWGDGGIFPMVPGHEISGKVTEVGTSVTKFHVGDQVGVGCMIDSCRKCFYCKAGEEQFCSPAGCVFTYNSTFKYPHCAEFDGKEGKTPSYGGYSKFIVVNEDFVLSFPANLDLAAATPLLCAGITTYSPIIHFGLKPEMKYGVIGLGGLGHMAVKFGVSMGNHTTVISTSDSKKRSAMNHLKASAYINSSNKEEMDGSEDTFDFIINTVAATFDIEMYMKLLKVDGIMVMVGIPSEAIPLNFSPIVTKRRTICGSCIGGIKETQEMLDFCGTHNIVCDIEMVQPDGINEAWERVVKSQVKYRAVIDMRNV